MNRERLVCAFTGHRPQSFPWGYNEGDSRCQELKDVFSKQICLLVHKGYVDFLSGMAQGVDVWAAQTVLALREKNPKVKLHCILPCIKQEKSWPPEAKERYYSIIKQADSRVYANRTYYNGCMLDRNKFMVDRANLLFAVYSGVSMSGTGSTVNYARQKHREILILDPLSLGVTYDKPS